MKKLSKVLAVVLVLAVAAALCVALTACKDKEEVELTVGLICLHDNNSTYDKNFIAAMEEVEAATKVKVIYKYNIPEENACYEAAVDLVDQGCDIIFADSFGHEPYMMEAAKKYPNVQFCHATGTNAHTAGIANFHNAFASIYEGRYLAGIAAGLKLNEMIAAGKFTAAEAKMGYVGAYTYAEVMSGYTSFYLGAKSVCPTVTMDVTFTGSWYNEDLERQGAQTLIARGCKLISQHADSMGAPTACEKAGVPNVSYNGSTKADCPNTFIVSSRINWAPYYTHVINIVKEAKKNGTTPEIEKDWTGTIATGSVVLTEVNATAAAAGTQEAINNAKAAIENGTLKIFDTTKFTVKGQPLTSYMADVNTDADYTPDTQVVINGIFEESKFRSAPYFNVEIDGITLLDRNYGD